MIPLSIPHLNGNEWKYVKECLDTNWVSSVGSYVNLFEEKLAEFTGSKHAVATVNGTAALHISLLVGGVTKDDYVIVPNVTFAASVNAVWYCSASPILMDIDEDTWQMDLDLLEEFLEERTIMRNVELLLKSDNRRIKVIMPVHILGNMCDMDRLMDLARRYRLLVIEDATEALGSYYKNKHAGSFGDLGCFSFNGNKVITTGGGGMIVTDNQAFAQRARHLTTQAKSQVEEYFHDEIGFNYRLTNVLAAIGVAQMEQLPTVLAKRNELISNYKKAFEGIEGLSFQKVLPAVDPNWWLITLKVKRKQILLDFLKEQKIQARPLWIPMNELPFNRNCLYFSKNDVSKEVYESCVSIPSHMGLTDSQIEYICDSIQSFYEKSFHASSA